MSAIREGNVAVITGAASGIGYALAEEALRRGMKVVVSDIREEALAEAAAKLTGQGADVLAVLADVTSEENIIALRDKALEKFGKVNLLINNAGAFVGGLAWETSAQQMDWIVDLNFKSVAHGIRTFVPQMIAQGDECHVMTVASAAGLSVYPGYATYSPTKHAALAITEALYLDLAVEGIDTIGVTVIMPGMVRTDIMNPEKVSPAALGLDREARHANATVRGVEATMTSALDGAMPPEELARCVFDAADAGELYILPNHDAEGPTSMVKAIANGRATGTNPWPAIMGSTMTRMFGKTEPADT
ncbi:MAG: SDR family NAD(P)-dependent oxidoreductase [Novosphingobium sp.]|nr:SDR family NAD(P)-dependent oxidoreductase [Novosphingobium sp.]